LALQALVDSRDSDSHLFRHFGYPRSVLGGELTDASSRELHMEGRVQKIVTSIDRLRTQHVAYFWARHTACAIMINAEEDARKIGNTDLQDACAVVSGSVIGKLDEQLILRRNLLEFGGDRPQGELFKWFGRNEDRVTGDVERDIAKLIFPQVGDKFDFLRHLCLLIAGLDLGKPAEQSWNEVATWASSAGAQYWEITPPDSSGYLEAARDAGLGCSNIFSMDIR